jgi:hypothetical protein
MGFFEGLWGGGKEEKPEGLGAGHIVGPRDDGGEMEEFTDEMFEQMKLEYRGLKTNGDSRSDLETQRMSQIEQIFYNANKQLE